LQLEELKKEIRELIKEECFAYWAECDNTFNMDSIKDDEILFGAKSRYMFDSIDWLTIAQAISYKYGIAVEKLGENKASAMMNLSSISAMANCVLKMKGTKNDSSSTTEQRRFLNSISGI
jgi:acyl carrier protein